MLSAFCGQGEDRTQYLSTWSPTLYPLSYPTEKLQKVKYNILSLHHIIIIISNAQIYCVIIKKKKKEKKRNKQKKKKK
jgi:hypothetical protein